tara:strand:+ start:465 stop:1280 length:816 start_codon:yes stop_codon:yes gene_type:complete
MFGTHFYHEKIRKSVSLFGRLFNNIYVVRKDASGGVLNQLKVPLAYAPRKKFLERIRQQTDLYTDEKTAIKLPRMSFEITSFVYDNTRQLTKTSTFKGRGQKLTDSNAFPKAQKFFSPVPYTISFDLNIYAKSQDDALQIVEQILPTFNPQYTVTIKTFPDEFPEFKEDIPIIILGVAFADDFEADMAQRRTIVYTLSFEMKVSFFGAIANSTVIRKSVADIFFRDTGAENDSDIRAERLTVTPNPTTVIGMPDSDFGFDTTIDLAFDDSA